MLTPEELEEYTEENELNDDVVAYEFAVLAIMYSYFQKSLEIEDKETFDKNTVIFTSELINKVQKEQDKIWTKINNKSEELILNPVQKSLDDDNVKYKKAYNTTVKLDDDILDTQTKILKRNMLNLTRTTAFQGTPYQNFYLKEVNKAFEDVKAGIKSYNQVSFEIANKMSQQGVQGLDYESGSYINSYSGTRRNILTAINQTNGEQTLESMRQTNTNLVEVTAHSGAREDHKVWQGGIFWVFENVRGYQSLTRATGYGSAGGLQGVNCRHNYFPFILGVSEKQYSNNYLENIDPEPFNYNGKTFTHYEATQQQRYMENTIRKYERRNSLTGTDNDIIKKWKAEYNKFSKAAGIRTKYERIYDR